MNYVDEQKEELEALSEIYYNEIQVRSNVVPISFSILVKPQASSYEEPEAVNDDEDDEDDDEDEPVADKPEPPSVELLFELPETYPDVKPSIEAIDTNLDEDELNELLSNIQTKAEESLGSVMIFMLVSDIVEWLSSRAEKEANELERERIRKVEELESEERRKAEGTPVTMESFLAWKAMFDAELLKARIDQQKRQTDLSSGGTRRLTGREMFEKDKALAESDLNFVDELEQDQLEALMQNINEVDLDDEEFELGSDDVSDEDDPSGEDELYDSDD